jgi:hypothetical protein
MGNTTRIEVAVTPLELVLANCGAVRGTVVALELPGDLLLEDAVIPNTTPPTITSRSTQLTA